MEIHAFRKTGFNREFPVFFTEALLLQQPMTLLGDLESLCFHADTVEHEFEVFSSWLLGKHTLYTLSRVNAIGPGLSFGFNAPPIGPGQSFFIVYYHPTKFPSIMPTVAIYCHDLGQELLSWLDRLVDKLDPVTKQPPTIHLVATGKGADELVAYARLVSQPNFLLTAPDDKADQQLHRVTHG